MSLFVDIYPRKSRQIQVDATCPRRIYPHVDKPSHLNVQRSTPTQMTLVQQSFLGIDLATTISSVSCCGRSCLDKAVYHHPIQFHRRHLSHITIRSTYIYFLPMPFLFFFVMHQYSHTQQHSVVCPTFI